MKSWCYSSICAGAIIAGLAMPADAQRRPKCEIVCMTEVTTFANRKFSSDSKFLSDDELPRFSTGRRFCEMDDLKTLIKREVHQACVNCLKKCQGQ
jgi:hypothetical protein